jgi:hypothetical protein
MVAFTQYIVCTSSTCFAGDQCTDNSDCYTSVYIQRQTLFPHPLISLMLLLWWLLCIRVGTLLGWVYVYIYVCMFFLCNVISNYCNANQCELQANYGSCSSFDQCSSGVCCGTGSLSCSPATCSTGDQCTTDNDCTSGSCNSGTYTCDSGLLSDYSACTASAECDSGICCATGSLICNPTTCIPGQQCTSDDDCASGNCEFGYCRCTCLHPVK